MFNLLLCLNSTLFRRNVPLILLCTYQESFSIHSHPLISSSRAPIFYFSHSSHLSSSLIVLLVSFRSRFVHQHLPSPLAPLFPYFSNLPEIVFFLGRDRLYHRFPFSSRFSFRSRTVYFVASTLKMLVRFNFLGTLLLPVFICFTPTAFYPRAYSISALSHFLKFVFFDLRFPERRVIVFFSSFHHIRMCYIPFALSNHFSLDPLILSIYPFHLPIFSSLFTLFSRHRSSLFIHRLMFLLAPSRQHQGCTFILPSSTLPLSLTSPFFLFYLDNDYIYLSPTNMYYPYMHLWWIVLYTFLTAVMHPRMNFVSWHKRPSTFYVERM